MNVDKLINEVIPPSDYQHRNGFNNIPLIDKLSNREKLLLEDALIRKLLSEVNKEIDTLIIETLAFLKSTKSLPILYDLLAKCSNETKLIIASSIFEINHDVEMIDIAIDSVKQLDDKKDAYYKYKLISAFYYLSKFKNLKINQLIKEYTSHPEYLISYNAKQALENE